MGITSQVRKAALKYYDALDQLRSSEESLQASDMVLRIQRERTAREAQEKLALEEAEADVLEERINKTRALGEAQAMLSELESAIGSNYNEPLRR
jgi:outer membrane protein TolC